MFSQEEIRRFGQLQTPFYAYNMNVFLQTLEACHAAAAPYGYKVHYALKANANKEILEPIAAMDFGADCVSGAEVAKATVLGFKPSEIVFAGVGKSDREITTALETGIACFNVESMQELQVLNELAASLGKTAPVALRINPNVNANTHHYITTGLEENKFGINAWELDTIVSMLKDLPHIQLTGLHFHIGSQITDLQVFKSLCLHVNEFSAWFRERNIPIKVLNLGGGLGVDYYQPDQHLIPDFQAFFSIFHRFVEQAPGQEVHFELGRSLVAQCGSLISRVLYIKNGIKTNFAILDAGMTELLRPALYQAYHQVQNISKASEPAFLYDVVGPICESSDCFGKAVSLPHTERGDLMAIRSTGAYGEVMSSHYNLREQQPAFYYNL